MQKLGCLLLILISGSIEAFADSLDNAVQPKAPLMADGVLNMGLESAGSVMDGQFSVLLPLLSTLGDRGVLDGSLVFAEPYATWIERGAVQGGLDLGVRHLYGDQPVSALSDTSPHVAGFMDEGFYIGANMFANMLERASGIHYWQMGLGAEIGTRYLELRGHYYLPLTNGETSHYSNSATYRYASNLPLIGGGQIINQDVTTVRNSWDVLHESLEGWDLEAAALVPWLDQWVDLKLVGGYSRFQSNTLDAIRYDSWKTGAELRPFPACVISATWYENQRLVGDHWMYGIRLELPFETADIGDGKGGFWGHIKSAFKPRRRHLAERLYESAHAHQLEPQVASYVSKRKIEEQSHYRETVIFPDGTVMSFTGSSSYSSQFTRGTSSSLVGGAGLNTGSSPVTSAGTSSVSISSGTISTSAGLVITSAGSSAATSGSTASYGSSISVGSSSYGYGASASTGSVFNLYDWSSLVASGTTSTANYGSTISASGSIIDVSRFQITGSTTPPATPPTPPATPP